MLALIVKGVEFEDQLLSFSDKEHKAPEYLKIAPRGKVPALVDGDTVVTESLAIIQYVDQRIPTPPLFGESPAEAGRIAQRIQEHEHYLGKAAREVMGAVFRGKAEERADEIRTAAATLRDELTAVGGMLENDPWLGGSRVSAADIVLYPTICLIDRISKRPEIGQLDLGLPALTADHPRLADFQQRFSQLPGVDRAHPPHWKS
jgi:glutathione S-transferase